MSVAECTSPRRRLSTHFFYFYFIYFVLKTGPLASYSSFVQGIRVCVATAGVRVVGKMSAGLSAGLLSRCTSAKTIIATATEREMKL